MTSVEIVSYANARNPNVDNLEQCLKKFGHRYQFLGMGDEWKGFINKISAYHDFCISAAPTTWVCCIDSFDLLVGGGPEELATKISTLIKPDQIAVGAEYMCLYAENCKPLKNWWGHRFDMPSRLRHLNSGVIIGRADALTAMWKWILDNKFSDDQMAMCEFAETFPEKVELDLHCSLVANITIDFDGYSCQNGRLTRVDTAQRPIFIHVPGNDGDLMCRYDWVGRCVLGRQYQAEGVLARLGRFGKHLGSKRSWQTICALVLIVMLIFPKSSAAVVGLAVLVWIGVYYAYPAWR